MYKPDIEVKERGGWVDIYVNGLREFSFEPLYSVETIRDALQSAKPIETDGWKQHINKRTDKHSVKIKEINRKINLLEKKTDKSVKQQVTLDKLFDWYIKLDDTLYPSEELIQIRSKIVKIINKKLDEMK